MMLLDVQANDGDDDVVNFLCCLSRMSISAVDASLLFAYSWCCYCNGDLRLRWDLFYADGLLSYKLAVPIYCPRTPLYEAINQRSFLVYFE